MRRLREGKKGEGPLLVRREWGKVTHQDDTVCTVLERELDVLNRSDALDDNGNTRCSLTDPGDICEDWEGQLSERTKRGRSLRTVPVEVGVDVCS